MAGPPPHLIFGTRDGIAGNEAFFRQYFDEAHVFRVDMEHRLDGNGARAVCDILEKAEKQRKA